ncbi:hypothetical protein JCM8547_004774 [Rhodosporidiobolus lusitaniae]
MLISTLFAVLSLLSLANAVPLSPRNHDLEDECLDCPLATRVLPEFPRAYHGVELPDGNTTRWVTLGVGNVTYTCRNSLQAPSQRAALYDIGPQLLRASNQTAAKRLLVLHSFLTGAPPSNQPVDSYIGFTSPISYTNTTSSSPCDETPRTVSLPSFTFYHSSPSCPLEGNAEKRGTFRELGRFPSPNNRYVGQEEVASIDWKQYEVIEGNSYATANTGVPSTVLQTDTRGGVAKTNCTSDNEGAVEVQPYVAIYWAVR